MGYPDKDDPYTDPDTMITVGGPRGVKTMHAHAVKHVSTAWHSASTVFKQATLALTALTIVATLGLAGYGIRVAFQSSASTTFPDPTNFNSPYGFTLRNTATNAPNGINAELLSEYKDLGVHWVRDQMKWSWAETSKGVYNWSQIDQQVQMANNNGLHIVYVIQAAPSWWQITCPVDGAKYEFSPQGVTAFATALANRYNGKNGHGYIDAYEIGNEDFDQHYTGNISNTAECRSASTFVPVLEAGSRAIKAQSPTALVGMFGMWWESIQHETQFLNDMYTIDPNVGRYFDYGNFHYYNNLAPDQQPNSDYPTFNQRWQIMHSIFAAHGDGSKPIWVTETGWDSANPTLQNTALKYIMDQSRQSGVIQKVFWYTINWDATKDIQPGDRNTPPTFNPLPAYNTLKQYVTQYPTWGSGGGNNNPPTVSLNASPTSVASGSSSTLSWSSTNATSCTASGAWSGSKATSGSQSTGALTASATYNLNCSGSGGTANASVTVTVNGGGGGGGGSVTFSHVFIIMEENKSFSQVIGSSNAPYINSLAKKYGVATNYHEVGSPSEPNYLGLTGGSNFGHTSDCLVAQCPVNAPNIADELEQAGLTWKEYAESMPSPCSTSDTGLYAQKHNPFVYYNDIRTNSSRCNSHDVPYTQFATDLSSGNVPDYVFITPNMCDDGHNGPSACGGTSEVANEDAWLSKNVPQILNSNAWKNNGLLVIMWDEQEGTSTIPNVIISPLSKPGFTSNTNESHYSLLRTIEDNWKLAPLANSANATAMTEYFTSGGSNAPTVNLTANPSSVSNGGSSTLSWSSTNATSCTASGAWSGSKATSGSQSTGALTSTATYTLTCTGSGGSATDNVTVTVGSTSPAPTVSLVASPTSVDKGGSSTLTWSSTNATSCTASGAWSGSKPLSGSQSTGALSASATYSLSCSGDGGKANAAATVSVNGGGGGNTPSVSLTASPTSVNNGGSSTLKWTSSNVTSCTASGAWSGSKPLSGSQSTGALTATETYVISCSGDGGTASDHATVTVGTQPPNNSSVTLDAKSSASSGNNNVGNLSWNHTTSNDTNRVMLVSVTMDEPSSLQYTVKSVSYGGKSLKKLGTMANPSGGCYCNLELWYLMAPPSGRHTVDVAINGGKHQVEASAVTYYNVNQNAPFSKPQTDKGYVTANNGTVTITMASKPSQLVYGTWATNSSQSFASDFIETNLWNGGPANPAGFAASMTGGATNGLRSTLSWKLTGRNQQAFNYVSIGLVLVGS